MSFPHCDVHDLPGLLWVHVALLSLCAILIVSSFASQFADAAPYGRHAVPEKAKAWGFPIRQRIGHMVSDGIPGVPLCAMVYMLYAGMLPESGPYSKVRPVNIALLLGWILHYVYRGFVHPFIMPYSCRTVPVGITLAGIFPNVLFTYLVAAQLGCTAYPRRWAADPRFIIGALLYCFGTAVNRWADLKLRAGRLAMRRRRGGASAATAGVAAAPPPPSPQRRQRDGSCGEGGKGGAGDVASAGLQEALLQGKQGSGSSPGGGADGNGVGKAPPSGDHDTGVGGHKGEGDGRGSGKAGQEQAEAEAEARRRAVRSQYFIPRGFLFELVSCPNYLGELIEWGGFALAAWSWPAAAWLLFCASTFIPRSLTHHRWYREQFGSEYPPQRRALIPFIF